MSQDVTLIPKAFSTTVEEVQTLGLRAMMSFMTCSPCCTDQGPGRKRPLDLR